MKLIILLFMPFLLLSKNFIDNNPSYITKEDLSIIYDNEKLIYNLADYKQKKRISINKIYKFIKKYKIHKDIYKPLKITANAGIYYNNRHISETSVNSYAKASIELQYTILDNKTKKDMINKKIEYNLKILQKIEELASAIIQANKASKQLKLLRIKYRIYKGEEKTGIRSRKDRIELLEKLQDTKEKLLEAIEKQEYLKEYLKSIVINPQELEKLL